MYIKIKDGKVVKYPYSIYELKRENPNVSFPENVESTGILEQFGVFEVTKVDAPSYTYKQNLIEESPNLINGQWYQDWKVEDKPISEVKEIHEQLRTEAYRNESDPLFFKAQRNEISMDEWIAKVNEIKIRYPD